MSSPPATLTESESFELIKQLEINSNTYKRTRKAHRNTLITLLMLDAGLRIGEAIRLHISDLSIGGEPAAALRIVKGISKSRIDRTVPLTTRVQDAIKRMFESWWTEPEVYPEGFAFYNHNYQVHISARQIERIISEAAKASIGRPIHPHVLRHTFASRLMRTTNTRIVQTLLGHKHLSSTQVYTHPDQEDLSRAISSMEGGHNGT